MKVTCLCFVFFVFFILFVLFVLFVRVKSFHLKIKTTLVPTFILLLIDNIFSNVIDPDIASGNLTAVISDHLPQIAIIPNMFGNILGNKSKIYESN